MAYTALFSSGRIGAVHLQNRIVMAPMASNFADSNGQVTDTLVDYYRERACGGAGLIIVEAACVDSPLGREGFNQLIIDHPNCIAGLQRLAEEIKACGSRAFLQLFHAGRQTSVFLTNGQQLIAPSAIPCPMMKEMPREMGLDEIKALVQKFINASLYAYQAGFDGVELHAAHGYLINQFLSAHSNQRTDEYGGGLHNRMRFLLEILSGVKTRLPQFPVSIRLNIDDFVPEGLTSEESLAVCRELERAGADVIHCSCGTYVSGLKSIEPASYPEGWRMYLAQAVKEVVRIPVIGGGMVRSPEMANQIIAADRADFVFLGRPLLADPDWPNKIALGREEDIRPCIACNNCISHNFKGLAVRCTVNPYVGREKYKTNLPVRQELRAVVVGGGPAGMQAALSLQQRGIQVRLYEQAAKLGGFMHLAGLPTHKQRILEWCDYLNRKIKMAGVDLILNHTFSPQDLETDSTDILVVATGSAPFHPELDGGKGIGIQGTEILKEGVEWSEKRVVIIGGGSTGCELAEMMALKNQVTIIEKSAQLATEMEKKNRRDLLNRLTAAGVKTICGCQIRELSEARIVIENSTGVKEQLVYDRLIWATGFRPLNMVYHEALGKVSQVFLIGDAREVRGFREAIMEGEAVASRVV